MHTVDKILPSSSEPDSSELRTFGLAPMRFWKFWDIDGWQLLAYVAENEDDDERTDLVLETAFEALGERTTIRFTGTQKAMDLMFEALDGRHALQGLLDQVGPLLQRHT